MTDDVGLWFFTARTVPPGPIRYHGSPDAGMKNAFAE